MKNAGTLVIITFADKIHRQKCEVQDMDYEFLSNIIIKRNKKDNAKRIFLTVGLIVFFIALVIELFLKNYAFLVIIIPVLYLLSLRMKMGKKYLTKEVCVRIRSDAQKIIITVFNCIYAQGQLSNKEYVIAKEDSLELTYQKAQARLFFKFKGEELIVSHDNNLLGKTLFDSELFFSMKEETVKEISEIMNVNIKYI